MHWEFKRSGGWVGGGKQEKTNVFVRESFIIIAIIHLAGGGGGGGC